MTALLLIAALINLWLMVSWILGKARGTVTHLSNSSQWSVGSKDQRPRTAGRLLSLYFLTTGYCSIKPNQ